MCVCLSAVCIYISVNVCLFLIKGFIFTEQHRKHCMGRNGIPLQKPLTRFHKELRHWLQRVLTDLDNKQYYKHYCLSSNIQMLWLTFMMDIPFKNCFQPLFCCSQQMSIRAWVITLDQWHRRIHNSIFHLCITVGCKCWLHGKSRVRKVVCFIVLLNAG